MKRDHVQLISDVGELTGLFHDSESLETFLQKIVEMISDHMHSEVCSIYLFYDDSQELVLKATKGLRPDSIGKVKMKLGEGLTGLALKELRWICEENASRNPGFKHFPGIGEEQYESFLAVPIARGHTRIGVIVVQNRRKNFFNEEDIKVFEAITSQLANTIETAKLLMGLSEKHAEAEENVVESLPKMVQGGVGSDGFAFAETVLWGENLSFEGQSFNQNYTLKDFHRAVEQTEIQLEELQSQIEERLSDVASLIFTAQILMLKDKGFIEAIESLVKDGANPLEAVLKVVKKYVRKFENISNAYLREKKQDVRDVGTRLLRNLVGTTEIKDDYQERIIVAEELFPSDILKLWTQKVQGIVLMSGGVTSHLSILARSLGIPLIITNTPQLLKLPPKLKILIDGEVGNIYIDPPKDIIESFRKQKETREDLSNLKQTVKPKTTTKDGTSVKLLSNINLTSDLKIAHEFKSEGVGLYRTEFPFIVRSDFPTEAEQYIIYKRIVDGMKGKEITFRTLDIGGDKVLSYYYFGKEENPFLGMRSIRFSLRHKEIFSQQIRAILRAGAQARLKIMFPMISSVDEFLDARELLLQNIVELKKEGVDCHENPEIGLMIELPAALEVIEDLAKLADFFSIGTNDFIQYMLAVDRTNEKVADLYLPHHPAILRALKKVVETACRYQKEVSICGDMAHDERYITYFLGIGVRTFSLNSRYIPKIQSLIFDADIKTAEEEAEAILNYSKIADTAEVLNRRLQNS